VWTLAQAATFLYGSVCLALAELYAGHDAAVTFYVGLPLAGVAGVYLANWRAAWILRTPAVRLSSPYEIELKARYLIHQALWGHHTSRLGGSSSESARSSAAAKQRAFDMSATAGALSGSVGSAASGGSSAGAALLGGGMTAAGGSGGGAAGAGLGATSASASSASSATDRGGGNGYGENASAMAIDDAEASDDVEVRMQAARRLISPAVLAEVHAILRSAVSRFRASSFLHVFFARFYLLQGNRHMQMSHLLQAERRHPPIDVAFVVFQARKLAEDTTGSGGQMSALNRVTFEKYSADARKFVLRASLRQLAFWTELLDMQPDLSRLHALSSDMNDAITAAERSFMELFAINPQSLAVMRLYASFNSYVCCNPDKAAVLLQEAER
jgi:hypothetical protein